MSMARLSAWSANETPRPQYCLIPSRSQRSCSESRGVSDLGVGMTWPLSLDGPTLWGRLPSALMNKYSRVTCRGCTPYVELAGYQLSEGAPIDVHCAGGRSYLGVSARRQLAPAGGAKPVTLLLPRTLFRVSRFRTINGRGFHSCQHFA